MDAQDEGNAKAAPDWERIEADFRAGILSLREIAAPFNITHTAIRKRAEREGWTRDLTAKIRAKAEALVSKDAVSSAVSKVSEKEIVEANAEVVANVDRRHKSTAKKTQALIEALITEIESITESPDLFNELGEMLDKTKTTDSGRVIEDKLNKLYRSVISMEGRVDSVKKLVDAFDKLAKFERGAYRLEDGPPSDGDGGEEITPQRQAEAARRLAFILARAAQEPENA
jgi:hypothetical protein